MGAFNPQRSFSDFLQHNPYNVAAPLLKSFEKLFPEAAKLIQEYPPAVQLVAEAASVGAAFGGYSKTGAGVTDIVTKRVYVPESRTDDPILAMKTFLFELHNAKTFSKTSTLFVQAAQREITAKEFAHGVMEGEVEARLRVADIWAQIKPQMEKADEWQHINLDKANEYFNMNQYKNYTDGKRSMQQLIEEVSLKVHPYGINKGKTYEQVYIEDYPSLYLKGRAPIPVREETDSKYAGFPNV